MSKSKQQGTATESACVAALADVVPAERLPEGGARDRGDVRFWIGDDEWIVECKATQVLNITRTLGKARRKAGTHLTAVWWKRLVPKQGKQRRGPDGSPVVVAMEPDTFLHLLRLATRANRS